MRWIGWSTVWEAARDMKGKRHLRQAQGNIATSPENSRAGGGDIHTNSLGSYISGTECTMLAPSSAFYTSYDPKTSRFIRHRAYR